MKYAAMIASARLVRDVDSEMTTGDLDYSGTALEISYPEGEELFHVVVDESGERQLLFFASSDNYRIPMELMERILERAKQVVRRGPGGIPDPG